MNETTADIVSMLTVIGLGLAIGRLSWRGMSLGSSGVIFVALVAGHFGFRLPDGLGTAGVVLFVYCLGIESGPAFLKMFSQRGKLLAVMAVCMLLSASLVAWGLAAVLNLSPALAGGLLAGALTSTPALAAAADQLPGNSDVAIGFGIAYPVGVIGVIVFVQLVPKLFSPTDFAATADGDEGDAEIVRRMVTITNPGVTGKQISEIRSIASAHCQISRQLVDGQLQPIPAGFQLQPGQQVLVIAAKSRLDEIIEVLGESCSAESWVLDVERQQRRVVVTSSDATGQSLEQLHLRTRFGVTVSRIERRGSEFVPGPQERLQFGDALTAVGSSDGLADFSRFAGHRERVLDETDLISLAAGMVLGILLGQVRVEFAGRSIALGLAGGPLVVGLIAGHLGHLGPLSVRMPRAARLLLGDVGLVLFLGQVGTQAGAQIAEVLLSYGWMLPVAAVAIVTIPLLVGLLLGRWCFGLHLSETTGGICGAMTSTPGLGVATAASDSNTAAASYATVYAVALIGITIMTPLLILQLS